MYTENYRFECGTNREFLKEAFGIEEKSMKNYDVDLSDFRLLIITVDRKQKYNNTIYNDRIVEFNKEKNNKLTHDNRIILIVSKTSIRSRLYEYKFLGFYELSDVDEGTKVYKHLNFYDYDKIFFCYPMYSKREKKYVVKIQSDSYRYDENLGKDYKVNPEYCIGKNELNTSDYIYENMKLLAMERAIEKQYKECDLNFLNYSELEDDLFKLAYSNIDSQLIGDNSSEFQRRIIKESSAVVNRFIEFMGE